MKICRLTSRFKLDLENQPMHFHMHFERGSYTIHSQGPKQFKQRSQIGLSIDWCFYLSIKNKQDEFHFRWFENSVFEKGKAA